MNKLYLPHQVWLLGILLVILTTLPFNLYSQVEFGKSNLNFNGLGNVSPGVTSVMFGPDGRLYVQEYPGLIKILTIERQGSDNYVVTDIETLNSVQSIVNHDDDGTENPSQTKRESTGLTVAGTAENPVIYATSSDFRIGAGSGGGHGDLNLDTNSGIITRISWNGSSWETVDLVRGLPRSEENHATNGLEFVTINGTDYLLVAQGGHTNGGGPSTNFVFICEYALSGAVLSINLDMLDGMGIKTDVNGRKYIYDLPTLDDPTRANVNGIEDPNSPGYNGVDVNDPFGGNDGLNMAKLVPGGPVQIYSPGYRNAYDLVVTESGALYVTDNGANVSWGGLPDQEGTANVTNNYDPAELGSVNATPDGEKVNNEDHLQLVTTNIQTYVPGSYYGGHPNPVRANPTGAGLFTAPQSYSISGAVFRTQKYDPDGSSAGSSSDPGQGLPADWPPVPGANPIEGDWRGPGFPNPDGPDDDLITIWGTNTNGIDEYTASNFGGAMKGDLIAGHNAGVLRRVQLKADGTLQSLISNFQSGIGGNALGVTCNSDEDAFPGTIWIGTLNGKIVVFEPNDYGTCLSPEDPEYDALADYDEDGYTNQDEEDNGTDACSGSSQPSDFDKAAGGTLVSDLNDTDDDADGIPDANDPFQLGDPTQAGSDAFAIPVFNNFFTNPALGGIYQIGFTGLMNNGDPNPNWLDWVDQTGLGPNPDDVIDGTFGLLTLQMTSGTALGSSNDQDKGYQFGIKVDETQEAFTISGRLMNLDGPDRLYESGSEATGAELGFFIGDGTQSNYIKFVVTANGLSALQEINDVPQAPVELAIPEANRPDVDLVFYFLVDPSSGQIDLEFSLDGGDAQELGSIQAEGAILQALQQSAIDLAVGIIGSSNTDGVELEGTWDYLNVSPDADSFSMRINAGGPQAIYNGQLFGADQYYLGGYQYVNANAQLHEMFQTERTSKTPPEFDYNIPIPDGTYTVNLYFAEIYWGATGGSPTGSIGDRVFDVELEGQVVLDDFDMIADSGPETEIAKSFEVTVTDGEINLSFSALPETGGVNQPKVSAIEIIGIPLNNPPVAVASADPLSGRAPLEVAFTGVNSTDDTEITGYNWDFKDGNTSTQPNPVHTFTTAGTYEVELTVEDGEGLTDTTTLSIQVDPPNEAPIAAVGADPTEGIAPLEVAFMGSASTDDVAITSYSWDFKDGATSTEEDPTHTFTTPGTYEVSLTVEDEEGLTDTASITIEVAEPPNEAPVASASASPTMGQAPLLVYFTGSSSTDDEAITSYMWDFKDGFTSAVPDPAHTFTTAGTYEVELTVWDEEGLTDMALVSITVDPPPNEAPVAVVSATPVSGNAPLRVRFNGEGSYDDTAITVYTWSLGDGTVSSEMNPQHVYTQAGVYGVTLMVQDAEGLTDTASLTITVDPPINERPTAVASADITRGEAPLEVSFIGSSSTDDVGVTSYLWDFKDGSTSTEANPAHTFSSSNLYRVELTVRDAGGLSDTTELLITVLEAYEGNEIEALLLLNPVRDMAQVRLIDHSPGRRSVVSVYIHDIGGRIVAHFSPAEIYAHGLYNIPVADLSNDLYFIGFQMSDGDPIVLKTVVNH